MADTANFGWTKPIDGGSDGAWGGLLNTLFDDADSDLNAVKTTADAAMPKAGGTFTDRVEFVDTVAAAHNLGTSPGSAINSTDGYDLDNGNYFYVTLNGNTTVAVPANLPASGTLCAWVLEIKNNASSTVSWNAAYIWPGGTPPTQSTGVNALDAYLCWTRDGGTTIHAVRLAEDLS